MRFNNVQAARALAANAVILAHLGVIEKKYSGGVDLLSRIAPWGASGVDLFFVVSGFIMATIATRNSPRTFILSRAARIYPPYWFYSLIVLGVSLLVPSFVNSSVQQAPVLWKSFLLVPENTLPLLAVGWTLIHEIYFYLIFTLLLLFGWVSLRGVLIWGALCTIGALTLDQSSPAVAVACSPLTLEFIGGTIIGFCVRQGANRFSTTIFLLGSAVLCGAMSLLDAPTVFASQWQRAVYIGIPMCALIYGITAKPSVEVKNKYLIAIGDASYSIYLSHVLVLSALGRAFSLFPVHTVGTGIIFLCLCYCAANIFGLLSFSHIEKPLLSRSRSALGI